jgi:F0F1-type ATP synthase assembly protein I
MAEDKQSQYQGFYEALTLGLMFPVAIGVGYVFGHWLDGHFGIRPWLTIIFTAFGIAAAFVNLFRTAAQSDGDSSDGNK